MLLTSLSLALLLGATASQEPRATTILEVSLVGPEGPLVLSLPKKLPNKLPNQVNPGEDYTPVAPGRGVRIESVLLDTGIPLRGLLPNIDMKPVAGTHRSVLTVERHRTVGLLGYSFAHGLVETIITPEMMEGKERLAVELALPAASAPGTVQFDFTFGFDRSAAGPEHLSLVGPLTGCHVHGASIGKTTSSGTILVPPGDYVASMWPRNENPIACYGVGPNVPAGVALWKPVTVESSLPTAMSHSFECPNGFSCRVDVVGREGEVADGLEGLMKSLPNWIEVALYQAEIQPPPPGWYVRAVLHPRDESSAWTSRELNLGWNKRMSSGAAIAPLGATLRTLDLVPPGEYVIELSGPWIEPASYEILVEDEPYWLSTERPAHLFEVQPKN